MTTDGREVPPIEGGKVKDPAGYIRNPASVGYPLRFAWQVPMPDGGKRIIVATDRPVSFLEATSGARTMDYPFMLIDVGLGPDGKGQGKLMPLAKIAVNEDHVVEIENYASEPVRLTEAWSARPAISTPSLAGMLGA